MTVSSLAIAATERGVLPDRLVRTGIRRLLQHRLVEIRDRDVEASSGLTERFVSAMRDAPIALLPERANVQHYELPARFFSLVLGQHRKYSSAWWPEGVDTLDAAEACALAETARRAELADGPQLEVQRGGVRATPASDAGRVLTPGHVPRRFLR